MINFLKISLIIFSLSILSCSLSSDVEKPYFDAPIAEIKGSEFLLIERETVANYWSKNIRDMDNDPIERVHFSSQILPETMQIKAFDSSFLLVAKTNSGIPLGVKLIKFQNKLYEADHDLGGKQMYASMGYCKPADSNSVNCMISLSKEGYYCESTTGSCESTVTAQENPILSIRKTESKK
ncbi:MAG: hypothetical protein N4A45_12315 [Flavobacteriales bacterium]|jgi:hypothetical protein|nr:hypothetical protein [Flavobacteriales bacterium]